MSWASAPPNERLAALARATEAELRGHILPFWMGLRDAKGGFAGGANSRGRVLPSAAKGAVLQARILWFVSKAYLRFADPALLDAAWHAYRFIAGQMVDRDSGGVFWTVSAEGAPADRRKHLYGQAFAIQGLVAFHRASGEAEALDLARQLWRLIEHRAADPAGGGYFEAFSADWRVGPNDLMGRAGAPKTFNAHFHLLEAYAALWEAWPDPDLGRRLDVLIGLLTGPMLDRRRNTFLQFFDADWRAMDDGGSFGHDIEASWLIPAVADRLSPATAAAAGAAVSGVAEAVLDQALEPDGGMASGFDAAGRADQGRIWWVQAEALVGFLDAFERRGEPRFLDAAERVWDFIDRSFVDPAGGEWRWRVDPPGVAAAVLPKAHLWKCPYHNGRACLEVQARAARLGG